MMSATNQNLLIRLALLAAANGGILSPRTAINDADAGDGAVDERQMF